MEEKQDIFDKIMGLPLLRVFGPFYKKYKTVLLYLFFGGLTTLISIGSFAWFHRGLGIHALLSNIGSWILAVLFAYVTNRVWVFHSRARGMARIAGEMVSFFGGRLLTLGIEEAILLIFVQWLHFDGLWIKAAAQIVVLILNFVVSKWMVFREEKGKNKNTPC